MSEKAVFAVLKQSPNFVSPNSASLPYSSKQVIAYLYHMPTTVQYQTLSHAQIILFLYFIKTSHFVVNHLKPMTLMKSYTLLIIIYSNIIKEINLLS